MDAYRALSLVDYIHLLHKGRQKKSLYDFFASEVENCSPEEVNLAIENLIIRYGDVAKVKDSVARFIRAVSVGLDKMARPEYHSDGIFHLLDRENLLIEHMLADLKKTYVRILPELKNDDREAKSRLLSMIKELEKVKVHYLKLQYGVFSALEANGAPTLCVKLMWHLQDSIWPMQKVCTELLMSDEWHYREFNKLYGQMFFLIGSLLYRENTILYPVASQYLSENIQRELVADAEAHGSLDFSSRNP